MKKILSLVIFLVLLLIAGYVTIRWYPYLFSKTVRGQILRVERVSQVEAIITGATTNKNIPSAQLFSFAVSIKDSTGLIHTASSEDRQWAVATAGQCVEARFFPYPPWELDKAGTYYNARLERLSECRPEDKASAVVPPPAPAPAASVVPSPAPLASGGPS